MLYINILLDVVCLFKHVKWWRFFGLALSFLPSTFCLCCFHLPRISSVVFVPLHQRTRAKQRRFGARLLQPSVFGAAGQRASSESGVHPVLGFIAWWSQPFWQHCYPSFLHHPTHTKRGGYRPGAESSRGHQQPGWGPESRASRLRRRLEWAAGIERDEKPVEQQHRVLQEERQWWKPIHPRLPCHYEHHGAQPKADLRGPCGDGDHWNRTHVCEGPAQHCGGEPKISSGWFSLEKPHLIWMKVQPLCLQHIWDVIHRR